MRTNLSIVIILIVLILGSCQKTGSEDGTTDKTPSRPTLTTSLVSLITDATATCGGNISSDGGATIIARGICWNTSSFPTTANNMTTDGNGTGNFSSSITGLAQESKYYVRAYATNSVGTTYGNEQSFNTEKGVQTITDIDGNVYHSVIIGTQTWMVENLRTTKYRNGETIDSPMGNWVFNTGAQCAYNNNSANATKYGRLYNWYATTDNRNIAPTGWHVATYAEWTTLIAYVGGASGKLKEKGIANWQNPNTDATNESGFTALPSGYRDFDNTASFGGLGTYAGWWSSTGVEGREMRAWMVDLRYNSTNVAWSEWGKYYGCSVRCIKDY